MLQPTDSVAALIPHYECQEWLADCLASLVVQTRPLQAIVVIDDASREPPEEIVRHFPQVTLLAAAENSGPFRLIQQVINATNFDAYLFNDADDWSATDRLETLLLTAGRAGSGLVGSQEVRILCRQGDVRLCPYPLDVNGALAGNPVSHAQLHPTSLVSRAVATRVGGFSTGLRFSADDEFLRRAAYVTRVVNSARYLYFRRKRGGSLTTSSTTGLGSPARMEVRHMLARRAHDNADAVARNELPDICPYRVAPPLKLEHVTGPELAWSHEAWRRPVANGSPVVATLRNGRTA